VARSFTFVATGSCGGILTASIQLQDGAMNLGTVTFTFTLGGSVTGTTNASNATSITIPGSGTGASTGAPASPYPSNIVVSGATGTVSKVTATLTNFNHTFPDDVDVLLVGPAGQTVILMSDVGSSTDAVNLTITLDDAAASALPDSTALTSGTFRPTNIGATDPFPAPAPAAPFGSTLSVFNGTNPNGTWSLFVVDDLGGDTGNFAGGWSLSITTSAPVCCVSACTLTCPANITKANDVNQCGAVVNYPPPTVGGTCGTVTCTPPSGSFFPVGTTTVNCSASAAASTCSFTVTVNDTVPPTITCPANIAVQAPPGAASVVVNYPAPTTTDNCPLTVVCNPPSGSAFAPGTTTVTCTATDPSSNTATCSFTVSMTNVIVRDDAQGVFIRFAAPPAGGPTTYQFFDCRKNISYTGTGMVTISFCKIELKDPVGGGKGASQNVSVTANPCTFVGSASVKLPGATTTYTLNDPNISNNPLNCP
jgi:subtilisin-like proprotein convertase family protein